MRLLVYFWYSMKWSQIVSEQDGLQRHGQQQGGASQQWRCGQSLLLLLSLWRIGETIFVHWSLTDKELLNNLRVNTPKRCKRPFLLNQKHFVSEKGKWSLDTVEVVMIEICLQWPSELPSADWMRVMLSPFSMIRPIWNYYEWRILFIGTWNGKNLLDRQIV